MAAFRNGTNQFRTMFCFITMCDSATSPDRPKKSVEFSSNTTNMATFFNLACIFACLVIKTASSFDFEQSEKCCDYGSILNDKFECVKMLNENVSDETLPERLLDVSNETEFSYRHCLKNDTAPRMLVEGAGNGSNYKCLDTLKNGTRVELFCESKGNGLNDTLGQCDSLFSQIHFWGASMVVFVTIIYNIPIVLVVIIYCILPELRFRAYDRAVSNYNLCYMVTNFLLVILGVCTLCHSRMSATTYRLFGLSLMFWTQGAVSWLFIICFDMTLVITRFRWAPKGGAERGKEEKRKCVVYAAWGWGFAILLTMIAAFVELTPIFPEDSIIRPNFQKFHEINIPVVVYVGTGPALICFTITSLFIYTTVKTIAVQKSTAIIQQNRKSNVKKRYFVFLKLYLLMDTPWLTSALAAIYEDLWILKLIKMIQPILILVLIVPRKRILAAFKCSKIETDEQENRGLDKENKMNH